jgi:hypothetical protein
MEFWRTTSHGKLLKLLFPHIRKGPIFGKLLKLSGDGLSVVYSFWGMVGCGTRVRVGCPAKKTAFL